MGEQKDKIEYFNGYYVNLSSFERAEREADERYPISADFLKFLAKEYAVEFCGFTVSPSGYQQLKHEFKRYRRENEGENIPLTYPNLIGGIEVVLVQTQDQLFLQWNDKKQMYAYIKMHEDFIAQNKTLVLN